MNDERREVREREMRERSSLMRHGRARMMLRDQVREIREREREKKRWAALRRGNSSGRLVATQEEKEKQISAQR